MKSRLICWISLAGSLFILIVIGAWEGPRQVGALDDSAREAEIGGPRSLRALALRRGVQIGVAVSAVPLKQDPLYAQIVRDEFSAITPENAMKWNALRPSRDRFDFTDADAIVEFAQRNSMQVRGHTLIWHGQIPAWLQSGTFTAEELREILREHILTVVGRYRGRVAAWDVVNEAVDGDEPSLLRSTLWRRGLGQDFMAQAFRWAHEADPEARLFYNDAGGEGVGRQSEAVYRVVKELRERGVPIHGVGLQMHVGLHDVPLSEEVAANMQRLADLGLEVQITEMDVQIQKGTGETGYDRAAQARIYQNMTRVCLQSPACTSIVVWGVADQYSWIPWWTKHSDEPLLFDGAYARKPAYYGIRAAMEAK